MAMFDAKLLPVCCRLLNCEKTAWPASFGTAPGPATGAAAPGAGGGAICPRQPGVAPCMCGDISCETCACGRIRNVSGRRRRLKVHKLGQSVQSRSH